MLADSWSTDDYCQDQRLRPPPYLVLHAGRCTLGKVTQTNKSPRPHGTQDTDGTSTICQLPIPIEARDAVYHGRGAVVSVLPRFCAVMLNMHLRTCISDDADDVNYQRRTMLGQASPHSARMVARTPHLGAGPSPLEISGFSRSSGSSPTSPYASSRASQFDAVYPRLQTDIGHPVSPSGSAHAAHSPYSAAESPVLDDITSPSWSPSYSCGPETYTMSTGAPAMYQAPLPIGHFDSAHLPRDEMWAEQAHSSVRIGRGYEHDMHRLNIGEHPESVWSPAIATVTGSQYASAPPTGVSITSQFPAVRGRDHVRTRSVPPIWSWGQDSAHSLYQLPPVSHPIYASHGARHSPT